jgi:hypothetical protein
VYAPWIPTGGRAARNSSRKIVPVVMKARLKGSIIEVDGVDPGRLSIQVDVENLTNDAYLVAQEGAFSPAQYSIPRLVAATVRVRF